MHKNAVCVITSTHHPFDTRIFHKEIYSLTAAGYAVTLIAPVDEPVRIDNGVSIWGFGRLSSRYARVGNLAAIGRLAIRCDAAVYHVHEPELLLLLPLLRILRPGTRFIYDVHENYADAIMSEEKHWIPKRLKPFIAGFCNGVEKCISHFADLVVVAAPDIGHRFKHHRTVVVRNFAPMHCLSAAIADAPAKKSGPIEFVYTGSLTRTRGIIEIVKAITLLPCDPPITIKMTGWFHDSSLRKEVEALEGFKRLHFLGRLNRYGEMLDQIAGARGALVCFHPDPNLDNAVERSNKLFEYMGMGIPLVISNIPGWADMITENRCGLLVDPMNPSDIAEKLLYLATHPDEAAALGENGRAAVMRQFNWNTEGRALVEAYQSLLSETKRPACSSIGAGALPRGGESPTGSA
jgi:glycosyltransferase involved in cell wall biosynthesis